jgi:hypothetical protein
VYPLAEDSAKMKICLSASEIEDSRVPLKYKVHEQLFSFQGQGVSGSSTRGAAELSEAKVAGLDFFGTFFGHEKKYINLRYFVRI